MVLTLFTVAIYPGVWTGLYTHDDRCTGQNFVGSWTAFAREKFGHTENIAWDFLIFCRRLAFRNSWDIIPIPPPPGSYAWSAPRGKMKPMSLEAIRERFHIENPPNRWRTSLTYTKFGPFRCLCMDLKRHKLLLIWKFTSGPFTLISNFMYHDNRVWATNACINRVVVPAFYFTQNAVLHSGQM